ncbi:MAG: DUF2065 domain-containing protein [Pseudomonadota bacterium]
MTLILLAFGLVLVVEGLALALAPLRIEALLAAFAAMTRDRRRLLGLAAMALGTGLIALAYLAGLTVA